MPPLVGAVFDTGRQHGTIKHMHVGAHVSAAGGATSALERGKDLGVTAMQFFGSSPKSYQVRMPSVTDARAFRSARKKSNIRDAFLHAPYLVNLASATLYVRKKSIDTLIGHMRIAHELGVNGVVFHIGAGGSQERDVARREVVDGMRAVLDATPGDVQLIMENASGGGSKLGAAIEEIASILKPVGSKRVRVCIDTAHAFASGELVFTAKKIALAFAAWEHVLGKGRIVVLHANDSKMAAGSYKDRHENIGEGLIGKQGFKNLAKEPLVRDLPWILEVPGFSGDGPDKKNVKILQSCF